MTDDKSLTNDSLASGTKKVTKTVQEIRENSKLIAADVASNVKDLEKVGLEFAEEKSAIAAFAHGQRPAVRYSRRSASQAKFLMCERRLQVFQDDNNR